VTDSFECKADITTKGYFLRIQRLAFIESDLPIKEISNLCGYKNEVHFMRQFKKLTTLTPTEYRRLNSSLGK